jgi:hypothetical protein
LIVSILISENRIMLTLKQAVVFMTAMLWVLSAVIRAAPGDNCNNVQQLPTSVDELFADVNNNSTASLILKAREPQYANRTITEVSTSLEHAAKNVP